MLRGPSGAAIAAHRGVLGVDTLRVENLELIVEHVAPQWPSASEKAEFRQIDLRSRDPAETKIMLLALCTSTPLLQTSQMRGSILVRRGPPLP